MRIFIFFIVVLSVSSAHAAFEGRVFGYGMQIHSTEMNTSLDSQNLKTFGNVPGWGIEFDVDAGPTARIGVRYTNVHWHVGDGSGSLVAADGGFSELDANMLQLMLRFTVAQSANSRIELFGGAGGAQATLDSKANSIEDKQGINGFEGMESAGATIILGAKHVYFTLEGGYQWAPITKLEQSDSTQPKISKIDLSGPFVTIGFMIQSDLMTGGGGGGGGKSGK